jgi:hypothetical protein
MKRARGLCLAVLLLCGPRGQAADTFEAVARDMVATVKQVIGELEKIKNEDTARAARPSLKKLGAQLADLKQRADKLGKPSEKEDEKLKKKYEKELKGLMQKMQNESIRVGRVKGGPEALKELLPRAAKKDRPADRDRPKVKAADKKER